MIERCYHAGWTDMRAMAMGLCEDYGRGDLAKIIGAFEKPPSGDK